MRNDKRSKYEETQKELYFPTLIQVEGTLSPQRVDNTSFLSDKHKALV